MTIKHLEYSIKTLLSDELSLEDLTLSYNKKPRSLCIVSLAEAKQIPKVITIIFYWDVCGETKENHIKEECF